MSEKKLIDKLTKNYFWAHLKKFSDLNLDEHYDFNNHACCVIIDPVTFTNFVTENKPLKFKISESNMLYFVESGNKKEKLFNSDVENFFSKS